MWAASACLLLLVDNVFIAISRSETEQLQCGMHSLSKSSIKLQLLNMCLKHLYFAPIIIM